MDCPVASLRAMRRPFLLALRAARLPSPEAGPGDLPLGRVSLGRRRAEDLGDLVDRRRLDVVAKRRPANARQFFATHGVAQGVLAPADLGGKLGRRQPVAVLALGL